MPSLKENGKSISAALKLSQWRFLNDVVDDVRQALDIPSEQSKSFLLLYDIDRLKPLLVSNNGQDFIDPSDEGWSSLASAAIKYQLGDRDSFIQPDAVVQDTAARYDYAIPIPVLIRWQTEHNLNLQIEHWETWMRETYPALEKARLLRTNTYVSGFTPSATPSDTARDNQSSTTVSFTQLQQLSGHTRPGDICAWMTSLQIPYKLGIRRRPFTTIKAINTALGLADENIQEKRIITV